MDFQGVKFLCIATMLFQNSPYTHSVGVFRSASFVERDANNLMSAINSIIYCKSYPAQPSKSECVAFTQNDGSSVIGYSATQCLGCVFDDSSPLFTSFSGDPASVTWMTKRK